MSAILNLVVLGLSAFVLLACVPALFRAQAARRRIRARGVPVTGTIIDSGVDDETHFVVVQYEHKGIRWIFREIWMNGQIGKPIPLLIDPDCPAQVVPSNAPARWFIAPACLFCGLLMAAIFVAATAKLCG